MQLHAIRLIVFLACTSFTSIALAAATDTGPESMILRSTIDPDKKPRTATFPHREHQSRYNCAECHHSMGADGQQIPYVTGQAIAKCESCHNTKVEGMNTEYNTFQKVGHAKCRECHRQTDTKLVKCTVCHKKE
ncbi:MAG: cytochrome c3 family protein [Desulfobulbaceae bacterium]|nr:cytochrome c3 family protein [Desulfobulbaceae bacterium]